MSVKHELVVAVNKAVFSSVACSTAINTLSLYTVYGMSMALIDKPSGTGGINRVGIAGNAVVLSIRITLAVMGTTDDNGVTDVTTDEVDEHMLSMTQRMGLSHVVSDEVAGNRYPMRAVVAFALPVISDMGTVVTVVSNGAAVCVDNTGARQTCQTRMWLSKFVQLLPIRNMVMVRKW